MDGKLFDAARLGDVGELQSMIEADPLLLERVALVPFAETPLHIAALAGKTQFVKEILRLKPSFACDRNKDGLSPLHIASGLGDIETARVLLGSIGNGKKLCLLRDHDGRTPLHYAAMKGKVAVIKELVSECSDTIKEVNVEGDTALHLAVKNKQFESLEALLQRLGDNRSEVLAAKNKDGFTIFQLAKATYQLQVLELLEGKDETGRRTVQQRSESDDHPRTWKEKFKNFAFGFGKMLASSSVINYDKNILGVVATLIATVTYQAALTPPQSVLKQDMKLDPKCATLTYKWKPKGCHSVTSISYMTFNTVGFLSSLVPLMTFKEGPVSNYSIVFAFYGLIGSYITLLVAMSSGLGVVFCVLGTGSSGFVISLLCGYVLPKLFERRRQSLAQGAHRP